MSTRSLKDQWGLGSSQDSQAEDDFDLVSRSLSEGANGLKVRNTHDSRQKVVFSDQEIRDDVFSTMPKLRAAVRSNAKGARWKHRSGKGGVNFAEMKPYCSTVDIDDDLDILDAVAAKTKLRCHLNEALSVLLHQDSDSYDSTMKALCGKQFKSGQVLFHQRVATSQDQAHAQLESKIGKSSNQGAISVMSTTMCPSASLKMRLRRIRAQQLMFSAYTHQYPDKKRAVHLMKTVPKDVYNQVLHSTESSPLRHEIDHIGVGFDLQFIPRPGGSNRQCTQVFVHAYASDRPSSAFDASKNSECVVRVDACKFDDEDLVPALGPIIVDTPSESWLPSENSILSSASSDGNRSAEPEEENLADQLCSDDPKTRSRALEILGTLVGSLSSSSSSSSASSSKPAAAVTETKQKHKKKTQAQHVLSSIEKHVDEELSKSRLQYTVDACDVSDRTRDYKYEFDGSKVANEDTPLAPVPEAQKDARRVEFIKNSGALKESWDRPSVSLHIVVMALRSLLLRAPSARFPLAAFHSSSGSLRTRAAERSQAGPAALSSNDAEISVRNAARAQGQLDVLLPLPGVMGLTRLGLDDARASVKDLIEAVRHADASLKTVEVATPDGTKLARTVRLGELTSMPFCLRLNHVNVLVESDAAAVDGRRAREENVAFATVKAEIEKDPRLILPLHEYYRMCHNAGAEEAVATKWLRELQRRNLVVHFDRSRNPQLENAVILRPYSLESVLTLQNSLDSELYNIKHDRKVKERQLGELKSALKKLQIVQNEVHLAARRMPNAQKWLGLTGLTGFYGALMYCVWDVYSWDVMEPITYFIGFTAVLGNSFYSTITKKDPTYSNMWQKRYAARVDMLSQQRKHNPAELEEVKARIADLENDITLLSQWEKVGVANPMLH
ncbi:hypothetical protein KRP22_006732 [Phytophthora ramorum]|nr:Calcium uniporter protein, mitochondrial [Phytophthora ramorum]